MRCLALLALSLISLGSAACGDDSVPASDAGTDAGRPDVNSDAALADADAGTHDAGGSDTGAVDAGRADLGARDVGTVDAGPGGENLIGTSLEGITVSWSETAELCTRWHENAPLVDELERKVHITLPPHSRPSLGDGHLAQAQITSGRSRRGPLSTDQIELADHITSTRLTNYELRNPTGDTSLYASIDHTLDDGSVLIEEYSVYRQRGDDRPVDLGGDDNSEIRFAYVPFGRPDAISLERCGGDPGLSPAIEVVAATNGQRTATIIRQLNTQPAPAGSFPVQLHSTIFVFSDRPWETFKASGFWAHTYSALHHNWVEDTLVDFTRDLRWYKTVYEPYLNGQVTTSQMITRARLRELNTGNGAPHVEIEWLELLGSQSQTETWTVVSGDFWHRVESATLGRTISACASPTVLSLGDYEFAHGLQLITCPSSSALGFELHRAVPFSFMEEPELVGTAIEGAAIEAATFSGRPGYRIQVGSHRVEISKSQTEYYFMTIRDSSGSELQSFLTAPIDLHGLFDPNAGDELFSGLGGTDVSMRLVRRRAGQGVGESSIFAPVRFELSFGGATHVVDTWDQLAYTNTHHNWDDRLEARTGELTLLWHIRYENGPLVQTVRAVETLSGREVLAETVITPD